MTAGRSSERGSATVLALTVVGALGLAGLLLAFVAGVLVAQRRVEAAADLAAVAGASALQRGGDGCAEARLVARRNGAEAVTCHALGTELRVTVRAGTAALLGRSLTVSGQARAGPG